VSGAHQEAAKEAAKKLKEEKAAREKAEKAEARRKLQQERGVFADKEVKSDALM